MRDEMAAYSVEKYAGSGEFNRLPLIG